MIPTRDVSVSVVLRRLQRSPPRGIYSITSSAPLGIVMLRSAALLLAAGLAVANVVQERQ